MLSFDCEYTSGGDTNNICHLSVSPSASVSYTDHIVFIRIRARAGFAR
jgi:hypothetical protein